MLINLFLAVIGMLAISMLGVLTYKEFVGERQ